MSKIISMKRKTETSDCPIYLKSQGKKWSPYIIVTKELCSQCPFSGRQCKEQSWQVKGAH